jgi:hypothetical protein
MRNAADPTFLGQVSAVTGSSVTVKLAESLSSELAIIGGQTYNVGQVGSFIRIPQGYQDLYGIVCEVGAAEEPASKSQLLGTGRWMRVELAGEAIGNHFERGLSQHPNINDAVHIVTEVDLRRIYGSGGDDQVAVGTLSSSENIVVKLSLDALVTRHSAILGSTGSGKSTTVASIIRSIVSPSTKERSSPAARILLLDIHGEYSKALSDLATVFSTTPGPNEQPLFVPFWALEAEELLEFVAGSLNENQSTAFVDELQILKQNRVSIKPHIPGIEATSLTVDSPIPFSLKKLWYDLIDFETRTFAGPARDQPQLEQAGDVNKLIPPIYKPHAMGSGGTISKYVCARYPSST